MPRRLEPVNLDAKQTSIPSAVKYVRKSSFVGGPTKGPTSSVRRQGGTRSWRYGGLTADYTVMLDRESKRTVACFATLGLISHAD